MKNVGKHCDRKLSSKQVKYENTSKISSVPIPHSNSILNVTRSLPLPVDNQTLDDIDFVKKEHGRVSSWSHYLDFIGGEQAIGDGEEWMIDMSQLFIGTKFASGTYSRLYHGIYKQRVVAVKVMRQLDEDDTVATSLEKQFIDEVTLLFRLCIQTS